jgi:hypothetical protein
MVAIYGNILSDKVLLVIFVLWHIHMEVLSCLNWFGILFVFCVLLIICFQAHRYTSEFDKRVFAVALSDSPMTAYAKSANKNVLRMLQKVLICMK